MDFVKNLVVQGNHMLGVLANFICHVILEVLEWWLKSIKLLEAIFLHWLCRHLVQKFSYVFEKDIVKHSNESRNCHIVNIWVSFSQIHLLSCWNLDLGTFVLPVSDMNEVQAIEVGSIIRFMAIMLSMSDCFVACHLYLTRAAAI